MGKGEQKAGSKNKHNRTTAAEPTAERCTASMEQGEL